LCYRAVCKRAADFSHSSGQDITDLAVLWTLALTEVPTTLISTASMVNMEKNLALARQKMMPEQKMAAEKLIEKFFKFLSQNNWENIEVSQYWDKMEEGKLEQNMNV
jgi:aryl-alcohol dehydrogenase-like predicted oxidoreductase